MYKRQSVDGEEFEGGKASDFVLAMGQGRMIPGFEDGIKGHKAGEEFTIGVTFPEAVSYTHLFFSKYFERDMFLMLRKKVPQHLFN